MIGIMMYNKDMALRKVLITDAEIFILNKQDF
jgi:hypothetical protein